MELCQTGDNGWNLFFWRQNGTPEMPCARNLARQQQFNNTISLQLPKGWKMLLNWNQ